MKRILLFLTLLLACVTWRTPALASPDLERVIYADALATGWADWSWATVNLSASAPTHSGSPQHRGDLRRLGRPIPLEAGVDTLGVSMLRFYIHGGGSGGQALNVFMNLEVNGSPQNGPVLAVPSPAVNAWSEVMIPLASLNPTGARITGITWQDASGHSQPTLYLDDIALVSPEDPQGPALSNASLFPRSVPADGRTTLVVRLQVSDPQGAGGHRRGDPGRQQPGGCGSIALRDDGRSNDGLAGDGMYGATLSVAPGTPAGEQFLLLTAQDQAGHQAILPLGAVNVLATPGGTIPATLPQRIGWGSNAWGETPVRIGK